MFPHPANLAASRGWFAVPLADEEKFIFLGFPGFLDIGAHFFGQALRKIRREHGDSRGAKPAEGNGAFLGIAVV
jgi:hypothetical protein